MKLSNSTKVRLVFGIFIIFIIVLVSFPTNSMSILDTDAVIINTPNNNTHYDVGQDIYIGITFNPQATSISGYPYCHAYQIVLKHQRTGNIIEVIGISGLNRNSVFTVYETVSVITGGEYCLYGYFVVEDMTYIFGDTITKLVDTPITTYDPSAGKFGVEFHNYIFITVGDVEPESSIENTEPFLSSYYEEQEQKAIGFSVIVLMSLPIVIYWRKKDIKE